MRRDEYKNGDKNAISKEVLPVFEETMRKLGFNPDEFLDEHGNWYVEKIDTRGGWGKIAPSSEISLIYARVEFRNKVMRHFMEYSINNCNNLLDTETGFYFSKKRIDDMLMQYMYRFVPYDDGEIVEVIEKNWLKRILCGGVKYLYASKYEPYTKLMVRKSIYCGVASLILSDIEYWDKNEKDKFPKFKTYIKSICGEYKTKPIDMDAVVSPQRPYSIAFVAGYKNNGRSELHRINGKPENIDRDMLDKNTEFWWRKCGMWDYDYPRHAIWAQFPLCYKPLK